MENLFKQELAGGNRQIGLWCSLANPISAEIIAGSGFDWLLIDVEHAPNDLRSVLSLLQAAAPYPTEAMVRMPSSDPVRLQQYLDIGARSLMIPDVRDAQTAATVISATRYPPEGIRSISMSTRANRYGRVPDYHRNAGRGICIAVQIESAEGVDNADLIAQVDGVDALFIGPADLSANLGHMGQPHSPAVQAAITRVLDAAKRHGKAAGILAMSRQDAEGYLAAGMTMVAVGSDQSLLIKASDALAAHFKALPL